EAAGVRRGRVHRLELRAAAPARPRRRDRRARQVHLRRARGELPRLRRPPGLLVHPRGDRGPRGGRRRDGGLRRRRELRRRDARRPLDRRARRVRQDPRAGHLRPARGGAPARPALPPGLHRRGLRLDRGGLVHRAVAAGAVLALQRDEGRRGPARVVLPPHVRARGDDLPRLEQLRAVPVSREAHPADGAQRAARRPAAGLRRRPAGAQLDLRRGLRARHRPRPGPRGPGRGLQRRRPGRVPEPRGRRAHHRADGRLAGPHRVRHRPSRPRPPVLAELGQGPRPRLGAAGVLPRRPREDRAVVPGQRGLVGAHPLGRLPGLLRAPVRPRARL
ncbi:MAG: dTDP-glucose 4,6-dehydratase, partial [uncultured Solirubrobacteraceae bacterium]